MRNAIYNGSGTQKQAMRAIHTQNAKRKTQNGTISQRSDTDVDQNSSRVFAPTPHGISYHPAQTKLTPREF